MERVGGSAELVFKGALEHVYRGLRSHAVCVHRLCGNVWLEDPGLIKYLPEY